MKIIWLGHSGFRIEIGNQIFLIDPWLKNNPVFPSSKINQVVDQVTYIIVSHGHDDHAKDGIEISKTKGIPIVGIYDLISYLEKVEGIKGVGFNRGGTITLGNVKITMVSASHSSSFMSKNGLTYSGTEVGFMISYNNRTIYFSGDTDIMADMQWFEEVHRPEIGILSAGGHFTMDMERVAFAASRFFNFKTIIPCHYKTFPFLEQSADLLVKKLPEVSIMEPEVLVPIIL